EVPFRLDVAVPILAAREVDAQEREIGPAVVLGGGLITRFGPHQIRSFALKLASPATAAYRSRPVSLPFDRSVASFDGERANVGFNGQGEALPAELLPGEIAYGSIRFSLGAAGHGRSNALTARGQTIRLPEGRFGRLYILASSADGDRSVSFRIGQTPVSIVIQDWSGFIGQWDDRLWRIVGSDGPGSRFRDDALQGFAGITPGFIKRVPVAWYASHHHSADGGNEPYAYAYLFAYCFDLPSGTSTFTVPNDDSVRILAATASEEAPPSRPARPLYDVLGTADP
ncbi:MAG TPA: alpha-mannosidase, partial [Spirochaetia bacterium]|nr:alpha-mannosidase [Spirochaetia bacterium]